ncbi:hypothetical protein JMN32_15450 [Fulvivirga sp. 29W222]|uniref:Tetratricopeptide repeat protein n=1 Tax=Fulvivirga marina TaxID=2494733 RepID=A0A937G087_9BACT|nr:hypothetical protein [Fulvivirga marina]MBL6447713.1 hypothetical protein [Fulvivirga marina]
MTRIFIAVFVLLSTTLFAQQITPEQWEELVKTNNRLLPKYGLKPRTAPQKESDETFINQVMKQEQFSGDRTAASNHMIGLGFDYLYRGDVKTAMYRFNQAYLLDSLNTNIYWGYGAVYMTIRDYDKARKQYEMGLTEKPENTHLLTGYGTYHMTQYYVLQPHDEEKALSYLDSAVTYMRKSYNLDPKDQNTLFKLSISYWLKGDCDNAWNYYDKCATLGGRPITEAYTKDLNKKCKRKK